MLKIVIRNNYYEKIWNFRIFLLLKNLLNINKQSCPLINKSTTPWGIYVGNPCKKIKDREKTLLKYEKEIEAVVNNTIIE